MGLYNAIFGENPDKDKLLKILNINQLDGEWSAGRFRDIYVIEKGGQKLIALYTRNGGGNRDECWEEEGDNHYYNAVWNKCDCPACSINDNLPKHPNYLFDEDDDFDRTYNTCYFSIPKTIDINDKATLVINKPADRTPHEKWDELMEKMDKGDIRKSDDPDMKRAVKVGDHIFGKIKDLMDK